MKFCKYCGKPLEDNAVCDCQASVQAAGAQQAETQPAAPQADSNYPPPPQPGFNYQQPPQPQQPFAPGSPYAVNQGAPAGEGKFVKALKNIPVVFTAYWKDSKKTVETAKKENDVILAALYTAIFFIANIIFNCCLYGAMNAASGGYLHMFNFGKILVASLLVTVLAAVFYTVIRLAAVKIFVKQINAQKCLFDSFIEFSITSMPTSIVLIVAGLMCLISLSGALYVSTFLLLFVFLYFIVNLVTEIKIAVPEVKNSFVYNLLVSLFVTAAVVIILLIMTNMLVWCSGISDMASSLMGGLF